jgi:hypothetical protein
MASKDVYTDLDLKKLNIIKDARHNPLTTSARNTLASSLGSTHKGLMVFDTDLNCPYYWNGTAFAAPPAVQSGLTPKGNVAFNATEPASPTIGDMYVFTNAGSNTWEGTNVVQAGDFVYWDGTVWQFIQGNTVAASTSVPGVSQIATQSEANAGTDTTKYITPETQKGYHDAKKVARTYFNSSVTTVADTPLTINHALNLQNRDAFVISFKVGNSEVEVDVDSTDVNNCTITSSVALTGSVTVIGY